MGASLLCGATSFSAALTAPVAARTSRLLSHPRSQRATILARRAVGDGDMVQKGTADRSHVVIFKEQEVTAKHGEVCLHAYGACLWFCGSSSIGVFKFRHIYLICMVTICLPLLQTLRTALLRSGVTPHNGQAQLINCRGLGTCGTCAVEIEGDVSPKSWNAKEGLRLNFPPHKSPGNQKLRLACQVGWCSLRSCPIPLPPALLRILLITEAIRVDLFSSD